MKWSNFIIVTYIFSSMFLLVKNEKILRELDAYTDNPTYQKYFIANKIMCDSQINCLSPNICLDSQTCKCANGYANKLDSNLNPNAPYCNYERKKQITAFLLQFFVFAGAGQFYIGNLQYAIPQLIITLVPCLLSCIICCYMQKSPDGSRNCFAGFVITISCLFTCTIFSWWLADVVIFGMNNYLDGNGVPLIGW